MNKSEVLEWLSHPVASSYRKFATEGKRRNKAQEYTGCAYLYYDAASRAASLYDARAFRRTAGRYTEAVKIVMRGL